METARTAAVERIPVRAYTPPAPIRLAPKRALLAGMASVVLAIQLYTFTQVRSQPRKPGLDVPSAESSERSSTAEPAFANGERNAPGTEPELSETERAAEGAAERRHAEPAQ